MRISGNLFAAMLGDAAQEQVAELLRARTVRIERIVSHGQASPSGCWYDQDWAEWVMVLSGSAGLLFEGDAAPLRLARGDYVEIPAHARHRVEWTDPEAPTIWLAVHHG